jgi:hypothetical protein
MRTIVLTLVASLSTFALCAHAQTVPLDAVMKDCEKKTIVMGRAEDGKMVKVGERISGYCQGILEGTFAVLLRTGTICAKDKVVSADFLLSTILTYRTETKSKTMMRPVWPRPLSNEPSTARTNSHLPDPVVRY